METEPPDDRPYTYVPMGPDVERREKTGCLDIVAATAGFGCAYLIRGLVIAAAIVILIVALRIAGVDTSTHKLPTPTPIGVLLDGLHWRTFMLFDFLHL